MSENVLTIENATMQFGGVVAVDNLNLKVDKNQIVSLIGPNGDRQCHTEQYVQYLAGKHQRVVLATHGCRHDVQ